MTVTDRLDTGLEVQRGTVTGTGSYVSGGIIYKHDSSAQLHATPEIWVRMEDDREEHLRGREFDGIRIGHELVLVWPTGGGELLRFTNLNTRKTNDYGGLKADRGVWAVVRASFGKLVTIYLPAVLIAIALGNATGLTVSFIGTLGGFALNLLFFFCIFLGWRTAGDRADEAQRRRAQLDEVFQRNGWGDSRNPPPLEPVAQVRER